MGLVKTRQLAYPPLAGVRDPWGDAPAPKASGRVSASANCEAAARPRANTPSDASSFAEASTFAKATVDESVD